jgi:hypothetical protein
MVGQVVVADQDITLQQLYLLLQVKLYRLQ